MKRNDVKKLTLSAMFLAMAFVLPFLTGQIQQIGNMLSPMHFPVILCGFFCGAPWGLVVGFAAPFLRSFVLGMPPMFPTAFCMAFELATYGLVAGWLYRNLPRKKINIYVSLISAMIVGRLIWGLLMFGCMGFDSAKFGMSAFLAGSVLKAIPGIILQIVAIPILVMAVNRDKQ